jgi:predicted GNAT family acetyltransferase
LTETAHVLDNLGWHALNLHHAHFAIGSGRAKRYPGDVGFLAALADHSDSAYRDLAQIVLPGDPIALFETQPPVVCDQSVPEPASTVDVVTLTTADVPEILHLIELTHPGPFLPRTIEMGNYLGIRQQGRLIAMAGERLYPPGYCEISAVCTHPDHQGKGYARQMVSRLVNQNWQRGDVPFLHVAPQNTSAIRLYETLHFRVRGEQRATVLSR